MARTLRTLSLALLPYLSLGGVSACGAGDHAARSESSSRGSGPDAGASPRAETVPPLLGASGEESWDAGLRRLPPDDPTDAGTRRAVCVPKAGADEPDDDFADTNCDGIDGDASAAIFVSPTGSDANPGSIDSPVRTLHRAIALATPTTDAGRAAKAVYVCSAEYEESILLDHVGVSLYGGYDCADGWKRRPDRAVVNPPSGVPRVVTAVTTPLVFEWLAFRAADAVQTSESSVAVSVTGSTSVRFSHVEFAAGNGADGADGVPRAAPVMTLPTAIYGDPVTGDAVYCSTTGRGRGPLPSSGDGCREEPMGGTRPYARCPDGAIILGGPGGRGGNFALDITSDDGLTGLPQGANYDGLPGRAGRPGAGGNGFGAIEAGRYVPTNIGWRGAPGRQGEAGHGGRGGASTASGAAPAMSYSIGGGGGQGGFPGCGGAPGLPGGGGGASIALIIEGTSVTLDRPLIFAGRGGRGGSGSDGTAGLAGGPGARGGAGTSRAADGADGGHGGDGGKGGAGGPGGGGPSIGVVFRGPRPVITMAVFAPGGLPGAGGLSSAETAESGLQAETYDVDPAADTNTDAGK